jgi:hypothetical protein
MDQINVEESDRRKSIEDGIQQLWYVSCLVKDPTKVRLQRIIALWDATPDMRIHELIDALRRASMDSQRFEIACPNPHMVKTVDQ